MAKTRAQLIKELNLGIRCHGTLTVLLTHAIAQRIGLSATEFELCDVLQNQGPTTAGHLAKLCGLSTGGVTGLVDRLARFGLVRRATDPADRRRVVVEPLERADLRATVSELYRPLAEGFDQLAAGYSDVELATIVDFIRRTTELTERVRVELGESAKG